MLCLFGQKKVFSTGTSGYTLPNIMDQRLSVSEQIDDRNGKCIRFWDCNGRMQFSQHTRGTKDELLYYRVLHTSQPVNALRHGFRDTAHDALPSNPCYTPGDASKTFYSDEQTYKAINNICD